MAEPRLINGNVYSFSFSTVFVDALGHGGIDHAVYAGLAPISQQTTEILLVFRQTFPDLDPGGIEV